MCIRDRRWIVGDETLRELPRDETRGGRMRGEHVDDLHALALAAAAREFLAEHHLLGAVVHLRVELELAVALRIEDRPASERTGDVDHVGLRVAAIHTKRM